jgi:protoheme IX farnesyltransferase
MVFWQMPHFYAIATFRLDDYQSADLPVLPVKQGAETTKNHIMTYMVGYTLVLASLSAFGYMDRWFLVVLGLICIYWLIIAVKGFWAENNVAWARQTFFTSLLVLLSFCLMLFIDPLIK